ncbi:MAG: ABC transporter substrate-binding protein [Thermodesulfovibrionales bacterium]|nr:ABC transporter substrate-binding protein [Thermodesulfovibrionales bacterium]
MSLRLIVLSIIGVMLFSPSVINASISPQSAVNKTTDKVVDILKDKELKKPQKTEQRRTAIRKAIIEVFDFEEMAKRSLAIHWQKRSAQEKKEFVALFTDLLERSYIKKIESYSDEKIDYLEEKIDGDNAIVKSKITTKRGLEIPIDYRLMKKDGKWFVYDVVIEGVSLVSNYRNQFNKIIRQNSYDELVKRMKNKQEEELFSDKN